MKCGRTDNQSSTSAISRLSSKFQRQSRTVIPSASCFLFAFFFFSLAVWKWILYPRQGLDSTWSGLWWSWGALGFWDHMNVWDLCRMCFFPWTDSGWWWTLRQQGHHRIACSTCLGWPTVLRYCKWVGYRWSVFWPWSQVQLWLVV